MKKILISYPTMMIGGSTTSLLSILNNIDYKQYQVDLILLNNSGPLLNLIPPQVQLLDPALTFTSKKEEKKYKIMHPRTLSKVIVSRIMPKILKEYSPGAVRSQIIHQENARISRKIDKEYDIAIAFIETWSTYYVANYVNAKHKIAWYHLDYLASGFRAAYDKKYYDKFQNIVLVSEKCKINFDKIFPEYSKKTVCIENILTNHQISLMSRMYDQSEIVSKPNVLNIVTTCRISFEHKGLDRAVQAFKKLKTAGVLEKSEFIVQWHIIGDGEDFNNLKTMVNEYDLQNVINLLGSKVNPLPYVSSADIYFLPSRYEGKPMAVTEAQILGVPVFVTSYASASEQIRNGIDGIIFENSEEGIYQGLRNIFENKYDIIKMKNEVQLKDYSNIYVMNQIHSIMEGEF